MQSYGVTHVCSQFVDVHIGIAYAPSMIAYISSPTCMKPNCMMTCVHRQIGCGQTARYATCDMYRPRNQPFLTWALASVRHMTWLMPLSAPVRYMQMSCTNHMLSDEIKPTPALYCIPHHYVFLYECERRTHPPHDTRFHTWWGTRTIYMNRQACISSFPLAVILQCCLSGLSMQLTWYPTNRLGIIIVLHYKPVNNVCHYS